MRDNMTRKGNKQEEPEKLLLSVKETCELTGLSERTVRTIMRKMSLRSGPGEERLFIRKNLKNGWTNSTLEYFVRT